MPLACMANFKKLRTKGQLVVQLQTKLLLKLPQCGIEMLFCGSDFRSFLLLK